MVRTSLKKFVGHSIKFSPEDKLMSYLNNVAFYTDKDKGKMFIEEGIYNYIISLFEFVEKNIVEFKYKKEKLLNKYVDKCTIFRSKFSVDEVTYFCYIKYINNKFKFYITIKDIDKNKISNQYCIRKLSVISNITLLILYRINLFFDNIVYYDDKDMMFEFTEYDIKYLDKDFINIIKNKIEHMIEHKISNYSKN